MERISHTPLIVQAKTSIIHAVTIDFTPRTIPSIKSWKVRTLRDRNNIKATITAPKPPKTSDFVGAVSPKD